MPRERFFLVFLFAFHFYIKIQSCFERKKKKKLPDFLKRKVLKENLATLLFLFQVPFVMQPAWSHQPNWLHFFFFLASVSTSVSPFHFLIQILLCSEFTLKRVWAFAGHAWNVKPVMFPLRRSSLLFFLFFLKSVGSHLLPPFLLVSKLGVYLENLSGFASAAASQCHHVRFLCVCVIVFKISRWKTQFPLRSFLFFTLTGKPPKCNRMTSPSVASYAPTWPANR